MSEQSEALRLADKLALTTRWHHLTDDECDQSASELRRQHARIEADEALMREIIKARDTYGWSVECDEKLNALRSRLEPK